MLSISLNQIAEDLHPILTMTLPHGRNLYLIMHCHVSDVTLCRLTAFAVQTFCSAKKFANVSAAPLKKSANFVCQAQTLFGIFKEVKDIKRHLAVRSSSESWVFPSLQQWYCYALGRRSRPRLVTNSIFGYQSIGVLGRRQETTWRYSSICPWALDLKKLLFLWNTVHLDLNKLCLCSCSTDAGSCCEATNYSAFHSRHCSLCTSKGLHWNPHMQLWKILVAQEQADFRHNSNYW